MILTLIKILNMSSKISLPFYVSMIFTGHPKIENNIIRFLIFCWPCISIYLFSY